VLVFTHTKWLIRYSLAIFTKTFYRIFHHVVCRPSWGKTFSFSVSKAVYASSIVISPLIAFLTLDI